MGFELPVEVELGLAVGLAVEVEVEVEVEAAAGVEVCVALAVAAVAEIVRAAGHSRHTIPITASAVIAAMTTIHRVADWRFLFCALSDTAGLVRADREPRFGPDIDGGLTDLSFSVEPRISG